MDGAVVALLVAGIPAAVAAATFAVAEALKVRASRDERIESAVAELAAALGAVAAIEDLPRLVRRYRLTPAVVRISTASTTLLGVVRRRDRWFAYWVIWKSGVMIEGDQSSRVEVCAFLMAQLQVWRMSPHREREAACVELRANGYTGRRLMGR
jgi:hypothetical protein